MALDETVAQDWTAMVQAGHITAHETLAEFYNDYQAATASSAEIYFSTAVETAIATVDTPVKALGTTTLVTDPAAVNFTMPANNRLTYSGTQTIVASVSVTLSMTSAGNGKKISFSIAKNGTPIASSEIDRYVGTGADIGAAALQTLVELEATDYVELWIENKTDNTNATVELGSIVVHAIN